MSGRFFLCLDVLAGFGDYKFSTSKNTCSLVCGLLHSESACIDDTDSVQKENICKRDVSSDWWQPCARGLRKRLCVMCSASHDAIAKCQRSDCLAGAKIRQKKAFVKSILRKVNSFLALTIEIRQKNAAILRKVHFLQSGRTICAPDSISGNGRNRISFLYGRLRGAVSE